MPCDDKLIIYDGNNNDKRIRINIQPGRPSVVLLTVIRPGFPIHDSFYRLFDGCGVALDFHAWELLGESSSALLSIEFKSDGAQSGHGFELGYKVIPAGSWDDENCCPPIPDRICGYDPVIVGKKPLPLKSPEADLPGFPNVYPPDADCIWYLVSNKQTTIELFITMMEMHPTHRCMEGQG